MVQWLKLHTSTTWDMGSIHGQGSIAHHRVHPPLPKKKKKKSLLYNLQGLHFAVLRTQKPSVQFLKFPISGICCSHTIHADVFQMLIICSGYSWTILILNSLSACHCKSSFPPKFQDLDELYMKQAIKHFLR